MSVSVSVYAYGLHLSLQANCGLSRRSCPQAVSFNICFLIVTVGRRMLREGCLRLPTNAARWRVYCCQTRQTCQTLQTDVRGILMTSKDRAAPTIRQTRLTKLLPARMLAMQKTHSRSTSVRHSGRVRLNISILVSSDVPPGAGTCLSIICQLSHLTNVPVLSDV